MAETNAKRDAAENGIPLGEAGREGAYAGKEHPWAVSPASRANHDTILNLAPTFGVILLTWWINTLGVTDRFYTWLNANYTPFQINTWWTFGITSAVYWALGLVFMACDLLPAMHRAVKQWKLQPHKRLTWDEYRLVCWIALRNQLLVALPLSATIAYFRPLTTRAPLPGLWTTTWTYFFCLLCEEIGFYVVHRAVHSRALYARVHKMHHQFTAPVALASTYCTLTEHFWSNLLPIVLGVLAIRAHWSLMIMFFCSLEVGTLCTHSDYNIPGLYDSLQHDWHHYSFTENFGPTGLVDALLGTNKQFAAWLGELKRRDAEGWRRAGRVELVDKTQ